MVLVPTLWRSWVLAQFASNLQVADKRVFPEPAVCEDEVPAFLDVLG
jgi:hypothetical protein